MTKQDLLGDIPETPAKKKPSNEIQNYPYQCGIDGCNHETVVTVLVVRSRTTGETRTGSFSDFGYLKRGRSHDEGETLILREGYEFRRWVTRCAYHYAYDVAKAGRSANPKMDRSAALPAPKNDVERQEYLDVLRNMASKIAKPMPGAS